MTRELDFNEGGNVIFLAAVRQLRSAQRASIPTEAGQQPAKNTVFFVTGGQFQAMVNGTVGVLSAGDFVRVPDGAAYGFNDIGTIPGVMFSHRFATDVAGGFFRELGAALPPFAKAFPPRGTAAHSRLRAIARRWRVSLGNDEAA